MHTEGNVNSGRTKTVEKRGQCALERASAQMGLAVNKPHTMKVISVLVHNDASHEYTNSMLSQL